jgi:hypothetical protein
MDTSAWIDCIRRPRSEGKYLLMEGLILFENQIPRILHALKDQPETKADFLMKINSRIEFDVVGRSFVEKLRVYKKMSHHRVKKPDRSWAVKLLFQKMNLESRVFMAQVELSCAQILLTQNPLQKAMAEGFGLHSELI